MKKFFYFAVAIIAMLAMTSTGCSDDDTTFSSTIEAQPTLPLSKVGGQGRLAYKVVGGSDSYTISATTNVDWISKFDYTEPGYVMFDFTALQDENSTRSGQITLSYPGAADVVVTVNQGGALTFQLSIDPEKISANGCAMKITPSDESQTYMCAFISKAYIDSFASDDDFIEDDIDYWTELAETNGMDLSTLLDIYLWKGTQTRTVSDLEPDMEYYGYVYGLTNSGVPTSILHKESFTTEMVEPIDCTFDVQYEQVNGDPYPDNNVYNVRVTVTPSNEEATWYFSPMNSYVYDVEEWTEEAYIKEIKSGMKQQKPTLIKGPQTFMLKDVLMGNIRVWGGTDYYFWFFGVDKNYNINTEVQRKTVTTNPIPVTDNCQFEITTSDLRPQDITLDIKPSNPDTKYYIGMYPGGSVTKYGANRCVERLLQRLDSGNLGDGDIPNWQTNKWVESGDITKKMGADLKWRIEPETTYTIVIFGFDKYGHRTTEISTTDFTTPSYSIPDGFKLEFEAHDIGMRGFGMKVTPSHDDVWYHVGVTSAENFDQYEDWRKFIDELIHSDGGGSLAVYVGEEDLTTDATPGTEYVTFGFAFAGGQPQSEIFTTRVTTQELPRNYDIDVSAEWKIYDANQLLSLYPSTYKGCEGMVFIFKVTPTTENVAHTWGFLHIARSYMWNSDMQIIDYFEIYPYFGWKDSPYGRYHSIAEGKWGFFYGSQDESNAWGELHYEEVELKVADYADPTTAPSTSDSFDNKKTTAVSGSNMKQVSATFSAPVRFSKASFIQIEREREDFQNRNNVDFYRNDRKNVATTAVEFDVQAQLKHIAGSVK